eukprot:2170665-Rhodomonas_salina.4
MLLQWKDALPTVSQSVAERDDTKYEVTSATAYALSGTDLVYGASVCVCKRSVKPGISIAYGCTSCVHTRCPIDLAVRMIEEEEDRCARVMAQVCLSAYAYAVPCSMPVPIRTVADRTMR